MTEENSTHETKKGKKKEVEKREPRIPTLKAWLAYSQEKHPDWPTGDSTSAWRYYERLGWKNGKTLISKWRQCVSTCYGNYKNEKPRKQTGFGFSRNDGTHNAGREPGRGPIERA